MLGQACTQDSDCQFMYHCTQALCSHQDIFPLSLYTIAIYIAAGIASSLCNLSGNSMGLFKMLIVVLALNYELGEATGIAQAMVVGTALPNFLSIIFKKHPKGHTSLVNYRLLQIIIPCCLLGSVLGAITQSLIPKIAQLIILVVVFAYFTFIFANKLRCLFKTQSNQTSSSNEIKQAQNRESLLESQITSGQAKVEQTQSQTNNQKLELVGINQDTNRSQQVKMRKYQNSLHFMDIVLSLLLFAIFQFLSIFFQGKFAFYQISQCSIQFILGLVALVLVVGGYVYWLRLRFKKLFAAFRKYKIIQDIYLDQKKEFYTVSVGAFFAGFIQGILGLGAGTCIMMVMMSFGIDTTVASATSGYQILFTGSASLVQFYINGEVQLFESLWFLGVCLVLGGAATLTMFYLTSKLDRLTVRKMSVSIILALCLMSIFLTIPTGLRIYNADGWEGLTKIKFHCE